MNLTRIVGPFFIFLGACCLPTRADDPWLRFEGKNGPGKSKHIVLLSGDEEYRSEEGLPQLAKILSLRHGFNCTVLFAIDAKDGTINPNEGGNIPGTDALASADLMIVSLRFRHLPDKQMKPIVDYVASGRPIIGMRTATHAFDNREGTSYARFGYASKEWDGGFGRQILGETWVDHHGKHGKQSTRGIIAPGAASHPILHGIPDGSVWGPTDVYAVRLPLPGDSRTLVLGQVVEGMQESDPPAAGKKNNPMMPIAWTKSYIGKEGHVGRVFTTTMGASQDLQNESFRRLLVNACYWALGMESQIPQKAEVNIVGAYHPSPFKFGGFVKGLRPAELR